MESLPVSDPFALSDVLDSMSIEEIEARENELVELLDKRSSSVRLDVARALGSAGLAGELLERRLRVERNELVAAEICDALVCADAAEALPTLKQVAVEHPGRLARAYACLAIADLGGEEALPFLLERVENERSRRTRANLYVLCLAFGAEGLAPRVSSNLSSKDAWVRCLTAELLKQYPPRVGREVILQAIDRALETEPLAAQVETLREARAIVLEVEGTAGPG